MLGAFEGRPMKIEYHPIGVIHSPFSQLEGMPIQPSRARGVSGKVEVFPEFEQGLKDLDGFSHIILLYHFHKVAGYSLHVVPFLDTELRGLFATRAPKRPNPIGLSVVRLEGIQGNHLSILDLDILDGTPVLDIKPYVPEFDESAEVQIGWLEGARRQRLEAISDDRFKT
jgi:tRNA-Thr(GGU) m(6)t(6)A37 methyltransferase TsaA